MTGGMVLIGIDGDFGIRFGTFYDFMNYDGNGYLESRYLEERDELGCRAHTDEGYSA